jgi:hypothetical protein
MVAFDFVDTELDKIDAVQLHIKRWSVATPQF